VGQNVQGDREFGETNRGHKTSRRKKHPYCRDEKSKTKDPVMMFSMYILKIKKKSFTK
jgi:hypothetical protein